MRLRQLVGGEAAIVVGLERAQADGAEELLRRREAREQPLEVARARDAPADLVGEHRLRGARRPDHQHVLAGEQRRPAPRRSARRARGTAVAARPGWSGPRRVPSTPDEDRARRPRLATRTRSRQDAAVPQAPLHIRRRHSLLRDLLPRVDGEPAQLGREERLVRELIENSLRLLRDGTSIGDLKILNAALRELRYAFKVFAPYRGVRKVTCFGSARTPPDDPDLPHRARVLARDRGARLHGDHGRRPRHHAGLPGGRRPGAQLRRQHQAPVRAGPERVHPRRPEAGQLPLLLHAQAHVREGSGRDRRCFRAGSARTTRATRRSRSPRPAR